MFDIFSGVVVCHPSPLAESSSSPEYSSSLSSSYGRGKDVKADSSSSSSSSFQRPPSADHLGHVTGSGSGRSAAVTTWTSGPSFDSDMVRNITAIEGRDVQLPCKVYNLGNRTVSWQQSVFLFPYLLFWTGFENRKKAALFAPFKIQGQKLKLFF